MAYGTANVDVIQSSAANTPVQFNDGNGTQVGTLCRAWVKFVGSSGAVSASFNVSSVTRSGTGQYTLNFTNALPDTNYSANITLNGGNAYIGTTNVFSTGNLSIYGWTAGSAFFDASNVCVSIFR